MKILTTTDQILNAHVHFANRLYGESSGFIEELVGFQGGSQLLEIDYSSEHNLWWHIDNGKDLENDSKLWNVYGIGIPKEGRTQNIVCEINYDVAFYNPRLGGALARNEKGNLYILHNGNIGGGRRGIGKESFKKHYKKPLINLNVGNRNEDFAIVCNVDSPAFLKDLKSFVKEIYYIKILLSKGATTSGRQL